MNANIAKRLDKEKLDNQTPGELFYVQPLKDDMYIWHFTLKGVPGSPYEGGLFHGHFVLPKNYPLNPPDIYFHNPNGRYAPSVKICLNITGYHRESWSPIWSLRKMMEAICAYFVCDEGGIGSVVMTPDQRKKLAKESRGFACKLCGPLADIEKIINEGKGKKDEAPAQQKAAPAKEEAAETVALAKKGKRGGAQKNAAPQAKNKRVKTK